MLTTLYVGFFANGYKKSTAVLFQTNGALGATRTLDRTLRRRMLYPAELRGQLLYAYIFYIKTDAFSSIYFYFFLTANQYL